jgi:hypothetical protein
VRPTSGRRGALAAAAAVAALALAGASAVAVGMASATDGPPQPPRMQVAPASTANPSAGPSATPTPGRTPTAAPPATVLTVPTLPRARPVSIAIESIDIDSGPLVDLAQEPDGTLEVPVDPLQAGWYSPGPAPGQLGPAVIAGHVDGNERPGVFYRLGELRPGATVSVTREDGSTAKFVVDKVERYAKDAFPTIAVYGDTTHRSELRLITCGGDFDDSTGHYDDNVVAYAHLF